MKIFFQTILQSSLAHDKHILSQELFLRRFKAADLSRTRSNLLKKYPELAEKLKKVIHDLLPNIEKLLHVKNRINVNVDADTFYSLKVYLKQIDVYDIYPACIPLPLAPTEEVLQAYRAKNLALQNRHLIAQPGLRYGQASLLRTQLQEGMDQLKFNSEETMLILNLYDQTVLGLLLEEVIMHELMLACRQSAGLAKSEKNWERNLTLPICASKVFLPQDDYSPSSKEINIVLFDARNGPTQYYLFEVKHSNVINDNQ